MRKVIAWQVSAGIWLPITRSLATVKEKYADCFTDKVRNELAGVKLSPTERPFTYKQRYIDRTPRQEPQQKDPDWSWVRDDIL